MATPPPQQPGQPGNPQPLSPDVEAAFAKALDQ